MTSVEEQQRVADTRAVAPAAPGALRRWVELFTLSGFVIAQPIYSMYGDAPEEFVFLRIDRIGVLLFAALVLLAPPTALWFIGLVVGRMRQSLGRVTHDVSMGALWLLLGIEILKQWEELPTFAVLVGSVLVGIAAIILSVSSRGFRLWLVFASPAPLVFALIFLLISPVSDQVRLSGTIPAQAVSVKRPAPIVVVVLDEFPLESLIDSSGRLETDLYPNFAALQQESHVFLNATSNAGATTLSVPTILTGRFPEGDRLPVATTHPENVFTWLGKSHALRVHELLSMCPTSLCPSEQRGLVSEGFSDLVANTIFAFKDRVDPRLDGVDNTGAAFGEAIKAMVTASEGSRRPGQEGLLLPARFASFVDDLVRPSRGKPPLAFLHVLIPHAPWVTLPDGRNYAYGDDQMRVLGLEAERWGTDQTLLTLARQRHLLQVQYADSLIGELISRMKSSGLWDRAAVVITSDHGVTFEPGSSRRNARTSNVGDLAFVPLFVKEPGQQQGAEHYEPVQLVDIVPTLADILDAELPWRVDGTSLLSSRQGAADRSFFVGREGRRVLVDRTDARARLLEKAVSTFAPWTGDKWRLYRIGPYADLVGRRLSSLNVSAAESAVRARLSHGEIWRSVSLSAKQLPAYVNASLENLSPGTTSIAVSVNGRIGAVSQVWGRTGDAAYVTALVPPDLLRPGKNTVRLYSVDGSSLSLIRRG